MMRRTATITRQKSALFVSILSESCQPLSATITARCLAKFTTRCANADQFFLKMTTGNDVKGHRLYPILFPETCLVSYNDNQWVKAGV